jgi:hypothetical protein
MNLPEGEVKQVLKAARKEEGRERERERVYEMK